MKKTYKMENLECANCAAKMESAISKLDGVKAVTVSFMTQKLTLETETEEQKELLKQLQDENLKLRIENAFLKELRRLRLEEEAHLNELRESSTASEENSN